jgi:hypothetical protein
LHAVSCPATMMPVMVDVMPVAEGVTLSEVEA